MFRNFIGYKYFIPLGFETYQLSEVLIFCSSSFTSQQYVYNYLYFKS